MDISAAKGASLALVQNAPDSPAHRLILRREVERRTGLPTSTLYEMLRKGAFPAPVRLTPRLIAFVESEIDEWIAARIASRRKGEASPRAQR